MIQAIARRWNFFYHLHKSQVFIRLWLMARRRIAMRAPAFFQNRLKAAAKPTHLSDQTPPTAIFAPRELFRCGPDGRREISLVNQWYPLGRPHDWTLATCNETSPLARLTHHYMEYLEFADDSTFQEIVEDWIAHNPPFGPNYHLGNWNSFALSIRVIVWLQSIACRKDRLEDSFLSRMVESIAEQMTFLVRNLELDIHGNHLIKNIKALLWAGHCLNSRNSAKWRALGQRLLRQQLDQQILADGMHFERSPAYHCQVFADLLECYQVMADGPAKATLADRLCEMAQALRHLTLSDGRIANFNDGGLSMAYAPDQLMEAYEDLIGTATKEYQCFALTDAGYFGCRFDDETFVADAGRIAPDHLVAHGQGDIFSFVWTKGQSRLIEDAGVFEYHAGRRRAWSRSTAAHNTVTLNDCDQADFWGDFRCGRRPSLHNVSAEMDDTAGRFRLSGRHDGYANMPGRPLHERHFEVGAGTIRILDRIIGGRGQGITARLLLAPEAGLQMASDKAVARIADLVLSIRASGPIAARKVEYYPDFRVCRTAWQLQIDLGVAPGGGDIEIALTH